MIVCWGGHSINENEYLYARRVGTQLGLRELNICTGCGPGAMEAPMKGAAVGHAQQRYKDSRFIGMTEPSIIAAEPPNPLVNELIIMPDFEKRLEAFVRIAHGIIIFPGGVGTLEELVEQMTWSQLGRHSKPILLANIDGFWDPLLALIDHMKRTEFIRANLWVDVLTADRVEDILPKLRVEAAKTPADAKLMDDRVASGL